MNETHVALVACSNGLGHVRRMLILSGALSRLGARPVLFAPVVKVEKLAGLMSLPMPATIDVVCDQCHNGTQIEGRDFLAKELSTLREFEIVVSDNIIEVLNLRPDAWLSGSFLWHRSLDNFPPTRYAQAEALLQELRPRMISSGMFAAPYLNEHIQVHEVGLYTIDGIRPSKQSNDVLVACGTGGAISHETQELVDAISVAPKHVDGTIFIEPSLYRHDMPSWMQPADFSPSMYSRIKCAVIRPGIGTVTDALSAGTRIFSFYELGNDEMKLNASRIASAGVGEDCRDINHAWKEMTTWIAAESGWLSHERQIQAIDREGASQAAEILLSKN